MLAIEQVPKPQTVRDVRRFLGMMNLMSKLVLKLADHTQPLRNILLKGRHWTWDYPKQQAFNKVKRILSTATVLALYNPNAETVLSADGSSYGLGAVLLQRQETGDIKPVADQKTAIFLFLGATSQNIAIIIHMYLIMFARDFHIT